MTDPFGALDRAAASALFRSLGVAPCSLRPTSGLSLVNLHVIVDESADLVAFPAVGGIGEQRIHASFLLSELAHKPASGWLLVVPEKSPWAGEYELAGAPIKDDGIEIRFFVARLS